MARCSSKALVFKLLIFVHLGFSQAQNTCRKKGENCLEIDKCVNKDILIRSGNYKLCSVRNHVTEVCCMKAIKPALTTKKPFAIDPRRRKVPTTPSTTASQPRNPKNATAIALENCKKYAEYRYVSKSMDNPIPGPITTILYKEMNCVTETTLIANGKHALPKEYPHMALIGYGKSDRFLKDDVQWLCGGSLISENFVLSAAHCSRHNNLDAPKWALLGDLNIKSDLDEAMPAVYTISRIYDHPNYNPKTRDHDITLYQLNTTVKLSPYVRPACLYTSTFKPVGTECSITGWGYTAADVSSSDFLLKATIRIVEDWLCKIRFEDYNTTNEICAGNIHEGGDTCNGDSGGPLQVPNKETCIWDIIGVISHGAGICGNHEDYAVYTHVAVHLDWIQQIVWP